MASYSGRPEAGGACERERAADTGLRERSVGRVSTQTDVGR
ncbi:MAG TPA: hypothetical protein VKE41_03755 [Roseiflexaceae bacterium]|nr:hypothetical protein [Roseiflexaceae bacterium]